MSERHFDARYLEKARLADGSVVELRLVGPEDKALLRRGFERLSAESRYRRFFGAKRWLTDAELRYFTEVDGETHLALGATRRENGVEEGLGVARFVRVAGQPEVAEAAVAVVDDWQGKGLGKLLLLRLVAAARERGVTRFRVSALAENPAARALIDDAGTRVETSRGAGVIGVDVELPDVTPKDEQPPRSNALYRLFEAAARGVAAILGPHG